MGIHICLKRKDSPTVRVSIIQKTVGKAEQGGRT